MTIFQNLEVVIKETENNRLCEEYVDFDSSENTTGRTVHTCVSLAISKHFEILVKTHSRFDWSDANCLEVRIDFDEGKLIKNHQVLLPRDREYMLCDVRPNTSEASHFRGIAYLQMDRKTTDGLEASISGLTYRRQDSLYQDVRFKTSYLDEDMNLGENDGRNRIRVLVERIKLSQSTRSFPPEISFHSPTRGTKTGKMAAKGLKLGITLDPEGRMPYESCQDYPFKTSGIKSSVKLAGHFVFHYRTPTVFNKIKASDVVEREAERLKQNLRSQSTAHENQGNSYIRARANSHPSTIRTSLPATPTRTVRTTDVDNDDHDEDEDDDDQSPRASLTQREMSTTKTPANRIKYPLSFRSVDEFAYELDEDDDFQTVDQDPTPIRRKLQADTGELEDVEHEVKDLVATTKRNEQELEDLKIELQKLRDERVNHLRGLEEEKLARRREIEELKSSSTQKHRNLREEIIAMKAQKKDLKRKNEELDHEIYRRKAFLEEVKSQRRVSIRR